MDTHERIFCMAVNMTLIETSRPLRAKLEICKYIRAVIFQTVFQRSNILFYFAVKLRLSIKYLICLSPKIFNL